jgi:ketosteroid isomerase-like protein
MTFARPGVCFGAVLTLCVMLLAQGPVVARADQQQDQAAVQLQVAEFFDAVAARDIRRMESLWVIAPNVTMLSPGQRRIAIGWPSVRKAFVEGVFTFWNTFKAAPNDYPMVVINDDMARAMFWVDAVGRNRAGEVVHYSVRNEQEFERHGDRWLLIGSFTTGAPD